MHSIHVLDPRIVVVVAAAAAAAAAVVVVAAAVRSTLITTNIVYCHGLQSSLLQSGQCRHEHTPRHHTKITLHGTLTLLSKLSFE
jgi:uncharacterized protein YhhL (DUF1145 family)